MSSLNHLADALAEAQEKVHGVEHIHLSKLTKDLLVAEPPITLGFINSLDSRLKGTALAGVRAGKREKRGFGSVVKRFGGVVKGYGDPVVGCGGGSVGCAGVVNGSSRDRRCTRPSKNIEGSGAFKSR